MDLNKKLIDLANDRADQLKAAEDAIEANDQAAHDAAMEKVTALDKQIDEVRALIAAKAKPAAPAVVHKTTEAEDKAQERMNALKAGGEVTFDTAEVMDSFTLASGSIVKPSEAGTVVRDRSNPVPGIIDQVSVIDLTGCGAIDEPYVKTDLEAQAGKVETLAGTARTPSDPAFAKAHIAPIEVDVTSYVDRNISRLSPVDYMAKIQSMAMNALRKKVCSFIVNGDGEATHVMYGIKNAVNTDGENIFETAPITANGIEVTTLQELVFAMGGTNELAGDGRLYLTKADLRTFGALRGTNEKKRLIDITPTPGDANSGTMQDGGLIVPYTLDDALTSVTGAAAGASAIQTMLYGNPLAYELGLFGGYTIRVDESYKAAERLLTILGDVMVGGNLVVDKSFVVATIAKA